MAEKVKSLRKSMEDLHIIVNKVFKIQDGIVAILQPSEIFEIKTGDKIISDRGDAWLVEGILSNFVPLEGTNSNIDDLRERGEIHCKLKHLQGNIPLSQGLYRLQSE